MYIEKEDAIEHVCHVCSVLNRSKAELVMVEEGNEPKDLCALIGDKTSYDSLLNGTWYIHIHA